MTIEVIRAVRLIADMKNMTNQNTGGEKSSTGGGNTSRLDCAQ